VVLSGKMRHGRVGPGVGTNRHEDDETAALVLGAASGDTTCWDALVERFGPLVWSVTRSFGLSAADAAEVTQTVWLRLAEHLDRIKHPERVGAWLVTTARRECIRRRRLQDRETLGGEHLTERHTARAPSPEVALLLEERDVALNRAFTRLSERSRTLLVMLLCDPPMSYNDISEALGMPMGSIGPTRARVLATLRKHVEEADVSESD
jgi:RNA polymerase sigma factor (sigma-70 family)